MNKDKEVIDKLIKLIDKTPNLDLRVVYDNLYSARIYKYVVQFDVDKGYLWIDCGFGEFSGELMTGSIEVERLSREIYSKFNENEKARKNKFIERFLIEENP